MAVGQTDGDNTLMHGPNNEGVFQVTLGHYKHLSFIAQLLNLKEHRFEWDERMSPSYIHLSAFTKLHTSLGYYDLEEYVKDHMGDDEIPEASIPLGSIYYLTNLADIIPIDIDIFGDGMPNFLNRLRPEFFCEYDKPLSADAFINISEENAAQDDIEVVEASRHLKHIKIPEFIKLLDSLAIMPIDSKSMTEALHSNGINMRYLGAIAEQTSLPHIKDIATVEILGRMCRNLLHQELVGLVMDNDEDEISVEEGVLEMPNINNYNQSVKFLEGTEPNHRQLRKSSTIDTDANTKIM